MATNLTPNEGELTKYMKESQELSLENSDLNAAFADALSDCRQECATKLEELFAQDFQSLMKDPVETLPLNLKARVDPVKDEAENQAHIAKMKKIQAEIQKYQEEKAKFDKKKELFVSIFNDKILNI